VGYAWPRYDHDIDCCLNKPSSFPAKATQRTAFSFFAAVRVKDHGMLSLSLP
jgi:hypothetical protein